MDTGPSADGGRRRGADLGLRPSSTVEEVVRVLVAQALDDLDAGRVDVAGALTLIATIAWWQGRESVKQVTPIPGDIETDVEGGHSQPAQ